MDATPDRTFATVASSMQQWHRLDAAWDDAGSRRIAPIVGAADDYNAGRIDRATFEARVRDAVLGVGVAMFSAGFRSRRGARPD